MMVLVNAHIPFLTLNTLMHPFAKKGETKLKMISLSQKVRVRISMFAIMSQFGEMSR